MILLRTTCRCSEPLLIIQRDEASDAPIVVYSAHQVGLAITRCPSCGARLLVGRDMPDPPERAERTVSALAPEELQAGPGADA
jgi:hypothetical protein